MKDGTRQLTLIKRSRPEFDNKERIPPKRQRVINACGHQGGKEGRDPLTWKRAPTACNQGTKGDPQTRQRTPLVCGHGI